jgi:hypothetical protein
MAGAGWGMTRSENPLSLWDRVGERDWGGSHSRPLPDPLPKEEGW